MRLPALILLGLLFTTPLLAQEKNAQPSEAPARVLPGMRPDGRVQLPTQWSLKPVGKQIALGDFPVNIAVHPQHDYAAILHAGYGEHEVIVVDLKTEKVVSRATVPQAFYGLTFNHAGDQLFVSGGEHEVVHRFAFKEGYLGEHREIRIVDKKQEFVPAGVALSSDDKQLYVAGAWGDKLAIVNLADDSAEPRFLNLLDDDYPYAVLPSSDGKRLFVSLWGRGMVVAVNIETGEQMEAWTTPPHPTEMILGRNEQTLIVSCANSNSVMILDLTEKKANEVITSSLYPNAPVGSTPNSIALSDDGRALVIANADNNNLAVFDVSMPGKAKSLGFIPVGWYPTSVRFHGTGKRILVANGKGLSSKANASGPRPGQEAPATIREYIAGLFDGTLSIIQPPTPADMAKFTKTAYECSPLNREQSPRTKEREEDNPIPAKVGDPSPIKYCIYVVKENRTYDQVFGDMPEGNGDKNLCIFPEHVTPNHHALARQFVLLDNFYVESEVSADGHEWSMAAYATDFTEKTWPLLYRGGLGKLKYPSEGGGAIASSSGGYIWDRCEEAGVSFRSYGEFINNPKKPGEKATARLKSLTGRFDPDYHGYDLNYPDVKRAARFIEELHRFEKEGEMPRMQIVRLPNDHTQGTVVGKPTPTAMVADNDLALGQLVEAVSKSKFWPETAIFVVQDDAQNGSDHVDAHRTVALVVSPYTKRKFVDSSMYSTASMLRTMELILGLKPMSQFDAAALPMYNSFQAKADLTPYEHRPANVDLTAVNGATAWGAKLSAKMDFSKEDVADDLLLNEVVWRSVRGANSVMPPPVRASFVFSVDEDEDEEEEDDD
jgi:DNA-binding beta-propeller fold protein YncE